MKNALTIDVEDYFMVSAYADRVEFKDWHRYESRIERTTLNVLDMLDEYGVKATFFVLGWVAEHYPAVVRDIVKRGHEIACHSYNHRLVFDLTPEEFRQDVVKARKIIEDVSGRAVKGYRAPSYSITKKNLWALDILIEEGFAYDSSIFPVGHDRYGYPEFNRFPVKISMNGVGDILEIPLSTVRLIGRNIPIAGGGYLRLFPLRFIKWGIHSLNQKESQPAIIYFHPWEVDPGQPKLNGSLLSDFRHNINIDKTLGKLKSLFGSFSFGPVEDVFSLK